MRGKRKKNKLIIIISIIIILLVGIGYITYNYIQNSLGLQIRFLYPHNQLTWFQIYYLVEVENFTYRTL